MNTSNTTIKDIINYEKGAELRDVIGIVKLIEKRKTNAGDPYYTLIIRDKDVEIEAKVWSNSIDRVPISSIDAGVVIAFNGTLDIYNNTPKVIIYDARVLDSHEYDEHLLFPLASEDIQELWAKLQDYIQQIQNERLKDTLERIFSDEKIKDAFQRTPGAEMVHHGYKGGLLEHTVETINMAVHFQSLYSEYADKDVVIAGAMLHDIGKIYEYAENGKRTLIGHLIEHTVLGMEMFIKFWEQSDKPDNKAVKSNVIHVILSHHTELEYGAVVRPATIEAAIVAQADLASSTIKQYAQEQGKVDPTTKMAPYNKFIRTKVVKLDANSLK